MLFQSLITPVVVLASLASSSRIDAISSFKSGLSHQKLPGSNMYHMKWNIFSNQKAMREECAAMTLRLGGKSFDIWAMGCYINSQKDETGGTGLKYSLRYTYYELADDLTNTSPGQGSDDCGGEPGAIATFGWFGGSSCSLTQKKMKSASCAIPTALDTSPGKIKELVRCNPNKQAIGKECLNSSFDKSTGTANLGTILSKSASTYCPEFSLLMNYHEERAKAYGMTKGVLTSIAVIKPWESVLTPEERGSAYEILAMDFFLLVKGEIKDVYTKYGYNFENPDTIAACQTLRTMTITQWWRFGQIKENALVFAELDCNPDRPLWECMSKLNNVMLSPQTSMTKKVELKEAALRVFKAYKGPLKHAVPNPLLFAHCSSGGMFKDL